MATNKEIIDRIMNKLRQCLIDEGIQPEVQRTQHDVTVAARDIHGTPVRVIVYLSERDVSPSGSGSTPAHVARAQLANVIVRPTLGQRSATGAITRATRSAAERLPTEPADADEGSEGKGGRH